MAVLKNKESFLLNLGDMIVIPDLERANTYRENSEIQNLTNLIINEGGIRDPFVVWEDDGSYILVDGFTRKRILEANNLQREVPVYSMEFTGMEEIKAWILMNQSSRRNLTDFQRYKIMGEMYSDYRNNIKGLEGFLSARGITGIEIDKNNLEVRTSSLVGEYFGVAEKTVRRSHLFHLGIERIKEKNDELADLIMLDKVFSPTGKKHNVTKVLFEEIGKGTRRVSGKIETYDDIIRKKPKQAETTEGPDKNKAILSQMLKDLLSSPSLEEYEKFNSLLKGWVVQQGKQQQAA